MIPTCPWPDCGQPATGILQVTLQESYIEESGDGWEYTGTTEDLDEPLDVEDGTNFPVFICPEGHHFTEAPRCIDGDLVPALAARALTA